MATQTDARVTYVTKDGDELAELHRLVDAEIPRTRARFGETYPLVIDGTRVQAPEQFESRSPINRHVLLGRFQQALPLHVDRAVSAARRALVGWSALPWTERVKLLRAVAQGIRAHRVELAVLTGYEVGKTRLESFADVDEAADLIDYYCDLVDKASGFTLTMERLGLSPTESNTSVLRPYGVWAVITPFNAPTAIAASSIGGALVTGNAVIFKPAPATPLLGWKLQEIIEQAGIPPGVVNFLSDGGGPLGGILCEHQGVDGIVFTGSKEVGLRVLRANAARAIPRPVITEMGGKNPALIMASADLDEASEGVMRSAFGGQGQKCAAATRAYVMQQVRDRFVELLVERTRKLKIGNPLERDVFVGPLINQGALTRYEQAIERAKRDGGRILVGGRRLTEEPFQQGYYVEPTIVDGLAKDHPLFAEELFVPILVVADVQSLDEALDLANRTEYGLTAGIFSEDESEQDRFFEGIQAGVTYANRRGGATTGSWPGINSFGGWKASGSTGIGYGGPYYLQRFLREQSRVRVR